MTSYRIAEAADLIGVPATTLRYYEDVGVVSRPSRDDNGYRSYSERDLDRLRFVARAKRLHLRVDDLRELADVWDTDDCSSVQHRMAEVVATRLRDAQQQVADLVELAGQLQTVVSRLQDTPAAGPCEDNCPCISQSPPDASTLVPMTRAHPVHSDDESAIIACSLDSNAVHGRIDDWQAVLSTAVTRTAVDDGLVLRFSADADTASELARLAAAEQTCCTFFDFRLHLTGPIIEFEVRSPPEASDVVAALFGAAA